MESRGCLDLNDELFDEEVNFKLELSAVVVSWRI